MSQNDFTIANQTFPNTRADINSALQALASTSSGSSAPSTTFANQLFYNTSSNLLQIRNEDNDAFITICELDQSNDTVEYFKSDSIRTALIEFTDGDDALTISDGGALTTAGNLSIGGSNNELRFYEGANFVGFEAPALSGDQIFVLPSADGSANQALVTDGSGNLSFATAGDSHRINSEPLIRNGDFKIAQRGDKTGITTPSNYTLDMIRADIRGGFGVDVAQSTDVPTGKGFSKSLKLDVSTADGSPDANGLLLLAYFFEGQDLQLLKYGSSDAVTTTLAFYVKSNKTGTFQVNLRMEEDFHVGSLVTISSANTWEQKVINFPANTSNAIDNDNTEGMRIQFFFDAGSDNEGGGVPATWASVTENKSYNGTLNLGDNTANEVLITGLQLEVGTYTSSTLPAFQHEDFNTALMRCQRYYQKSYDHATAPATTTFNGMKFFNTISSGTNNIGGSVDLKVSMRTAPTVTFYDQAGNVNKFYKGVNNKNGVADMIGTDRFRVISQDTTTASEGGYHFEANASI